MQINDGSFPNQIQITQNIYSNNAKHIKTYAQINYKNSYTIKRR